MEILYKNIQLMLDFLKVPFLVLHFYYYTLMIFLMMLSDVAIYADDTAVFLSVIIHLICGNS